MNDPFEIIIAITMMYMAYKLLYLIEDYKTDPILKKEKEK